MSQICPFLILAYTIFISRWFMTDVTLKEISEINKRMHAVLEESRRLYRVSLNAMFASHNIEHGVEGFIEVTSLLRDFSSRLDKQVKVLAGLVTESIFGVAILLKLNKRLVLIEKAFTNIKQRHKVLTIERDHQLYAEKSENMIRKIAVEVERSLMLVGVGENLAVLAKVEASGVPVEINDLTTIINDMEIIITNINKYISESRLLITEKQ